MAVNHADPHAVDPVGADDIDLVERLVVALVTGVFFPALTDVSATSPGMVATGDEVGVLVQSGRSTPSSARSPVSCSGCWPNPASVPCGCTSPSRGSRSPTSRDAVRAPGRPTADADRCGPTERAT